MRPLRLVLVLAAMFAGSLFTAPAAQAGGWAVTALDPLPQRIEAGRTYTAGYWVLQHGSHPYDGPLGATGLKFVDDNGTVIASKGAALGEPAHFAAAFALPHGGSWTVWGQQGIFADYEIGTLTPPGGLTVVRPPTPMTMDGDTHWAAIRPPDIAAMARDMTLPANALSGDETAGTQSLAPATQSPAPRSTSTDPPSAGTTRPLQIAAVLGLGVLLATSLLVGRRRRHRPPAEAAVSGDAEELSSK